MTILVLYSESIMFMIPKNRKYTKRIEVITNTVAAPIVLLSLCFIALGVVFNPLLSPDMAMVFGIEKRVPLTVEWVEFKPASLPMPAKYGGSGGPNCTYWKVYGSYQGRDLVAQSCYSKNNRKFTHIARVGEKLDVIVAPYGNNTRLVGEEYNSYGTRMGEKVAIALFFISVPYGIFIGFRMLYIGYSSNWKWSSKPRD